MHSQPFFPLEKSFVALRDLSHRVFAVSRDVVINNHDVVRLSSSLVRPCSRTRIHEFKLKEEKKKKSNVPVSCFLVRTSEYGHGK